MSIFKIIKRAKTSLLGKWGKGIGITLTYLVFQVIMNYVLYLLQDAPLRSIIRLINLLTQTPISFGLGYAFIKLKRNENVSVFDFFSLGFYNFAKAWKVSLKILAKMIIPILLMSFSSLAFIALLWGGSILVFFDIALLIVSLIWSISRYLKYSLTTYITYDNPDMNPSNILEESARMMNKNKLKMFLLLLSFCIVYIIPKILIDMGLTIQGILLSLVLTTLILPYMQVACICFYENLLGKDDESNIVNNPDKIEEVIREM